MHCSKVQNTYKKNSPVKFTFLYFIKMLLMLPGYSHGYELFYNVSILYLPGTLSVWKNNLSKSGKLRTPYLNKTLPVRVMIVPREVLPYTLLRTTPVVCLLCCFTFLKEHVTITWEHTVTVVSSLPTG